MNKLAYFYLKVKVNKVLSNGVLSEVAGFFKFSHIRIIGYFRLGKG